MKIRGNTVGTTMPRTNWNQTDPTKADYLKGKDDLEKIIEEAQTAADNAQTTADDAQTAADNAQTAADNAQTAADNAQTAADNAQTAADNAQTAADNAQTTADGKVAKTEASVTLVSGNWLDKQQTVVVRGVTNSNTVIVSPASSSHVAYCEAVIRHSVQGSGTITFECEDVPDEDIVLNVLILDGIGTGSSGGSGDAGGSGGSGGSGKDGISPVAIVKQTDTGVIISITDANGTTTATVSNGNDYVLNDEDIAEIVTLVVKQMESSGGSGGSGNSNLTGGFSEGLRVAIYNLLMDAVYQSSGHEADKAALEELLGIVDDGGINGGSEYVSFMVTKTLTNVSIEDYGTGSMAREGYPYNAVLTADDGYTLSEVTVTMGGEPVTVTDGVIFIASVTGDIVIVATAT